MNRCIATISVRELLTREVDIDVCDDYDESIYIAFCGPQKLTEEGAKVFQPVMDVNVDICMDSCFASLCINDMPDDERRVKKPLLKKLFYGAAGYIADTEYQRLFADSDD